MGSGIKEIVNAAVGSGDRQQLFYCQPTRLIGTPEWAKNKHNQLTQMLNVTYM